mmetsp:Transcript_18383/g.45606  ORF Transcript_18383/g.45606 Transcript_18383/m.45606 type:complete len:455 (-) Transcript_18383:69-1433(-)
MQTSTTSLLVKVARDVFIVGCGILVLLVFGDKIVQVRLSLCELHLVHTLTSVPMKESLAAEHDTELIGDTLPGLLDGGGVTDKDSGHFKSLGGNITDGSLDVIGDPFNKVGRVLGDHLVHLVVDNLGREVTSEHHGAGEVTSVTRISGAHHVLGIKGLLGELRNSHDTESLRAVGSQRRESNHEKVKTGERNHVNGKLSEIAVKLTGESKRARRSGDGIGDQVVEVTEGGVFKLESAEANVVKSFVIKSVTLVGVLDKLVDRERGIVRLDNGVRDLGGRDDTVGADDTVGVFLLDLGDKKSSHTGTGTSSHGVGDLETLKDVAGFGFLSDTFHDGVNEFSSLGVVTLGPVISGSTLSEDKVIGAEELSERSTANGVHGTGFQIGKDGTRDISPTLAFVEVDTNTIQLAGDVTSIGSGGVNAVLGGHDLPELGSNLVTALSGLDVNDFSHLDKVF